MNRRALRRSAMTLVAGVCPAAADAQPCNSQVAKVVGVTADQQVGRAVALSGDASTAMAASWADAGSVSVFVDSPGGWVQQGPPLAPVGGASAMQKFGNAVALSFDGDTALIGASGDPGTGGAVYVFTRVGGVWSQGPKLSANGGLFGTSVSVSADGDTALIGAVFDEASGSAYVFSRSDGVWIQQGPKLVPTGSIGLSFFGVAVALSADGRTAMVGAHRDASYIGAAYVFVPSGEAWVQQGPKIVVPSVVGPAQYFGRSVSLSADGNTAMVGVPANNNNLGAVHAFVRSGGAWAQQGPKLVPTGSVSQGAYFGWSTSLSADGNRVLIGAVNDNAAYLFVRAGDAWEQHARIKPVGGVGNPGYGSRVSFSADGTRAAVGAPHEKFSAGAAYLLDVHCVLCYADCDEDNRLSVSDFPCFQTRFALGEPYADCNADGTPDVADFGCFQTRFVLGCP